MKRYVGAATAGLMAATALCLPFTLAYAEGNEVEPAHEKPRLQFSVISDIHLQRWTPSTHHKLKAALTDLSETVTEAQALVVNGDLGNGHEEEYELFAKLLKEAQHPDQVYYTIGNHEFYKAWENGLGVWNPNGFPNGETEAMSIGRFLTFTGYQKVYHDAWVEGYHFLFLGSEAYRQSDPDHREDAYLTPEQLKWFETTISEKAEEDRPIFVFLHQPLPYTVSGSDMYVNDRAVIQHEELRAILSRYPQAVFFSGHSHYELSLPKTMVRDGFTMINSSSVHSPHDENDVAYEEGDKMSEGLTVEVYEDEVHVRGRNFAKREWVPEADFTIPLHARED